MRLVTVRLQVILLYTVLHIRQRLRIQLRTQQVDQRQLRTILQEVPLRLIILATVLRLLIQQVTLRLLHIIQVAVLQRVQLQRMQQVIVQQLRLILVIVQQLRMQQVIVQQLRLTQVKVQRQRILLRTLLHILLR